MDSTRTLCVTQLNGTRGKYESHLRIIFLGFYQRNSVSNRKLIKMPQRNQTQNPSTAEVFNEVANPPPLLISATIDNNENPHSLIEPVSSTPDDRLHTVLEIERIGIFSNFHSWWLQHSAIGENRDFNLIERERQPLADKDATIAHLSHQISQRQHCIKQLEDLVQLQREFLESNHSLKTEADQGCKNSTSEEGGTQGSHKKIRETNKFIASLSDTIEKQQEELASMREEIMALKKDDEDKNVFNEMKSIIQDLHTKLEDRNTTQFALVRSVKLQNKEIADLRSENRLLNEKKKMYETLWNRSKHFVRKNMDGSFPKES